MKGFDGCFGAKVILECDAFKVFDAAQKFVQIDAAVLEVTDLCAHFVIGNGTVDDVVIMNGFVGIVFPVVIDKLGPLFREESKVLTFI